LIIDEADLLFGSKRSGEQNEDLKKLLNAGHQRNRPAIRCVGPLQIPTQFPVFAMCAIAGIGTMPDTITDRAVNITMRRRAPGESVSQFRSRRDAPILAALRDRLAAWAAPRIEDLTKAEPDMPVEDRAADTWEPLVAIADAAGGHWPELGRAACKVLTDAADEADEDRSLAVKLLGDIRSVFGDKSVSFLSSTELIAELRRIEESPSDDFDLTSRKLAHRLKDYGIKPERIGHDAVRGYKLESLYDAFTRYLRQQPSASIAAQVNPQKRADGSEGADGSIRQHENIRQRENVGLPAVRQMLTDGDTSPSGSGKARMFKPPTGPGRCPECGWHIPTQGHQPDCTANEGDTA
jgi:hypothetical protein